MLNVPRAEQAPGATTSMLEQMGTYSQEHKRCNSLFHQIKCKIKKPKSGSWVSLIQLPPPLLLFPPVLILLHTMNRSTMDPMQMAHDQQCKPLARVKEHQLGCVLLSISFCFQRSFSFLKDAEAPSLDCTFTVAL